MMKSNILEVYEIHRGMLRKTGVWPEEHSTVLYHLRLIITWILGLALVITMWMEVLNDVNDFGKLSEIFYVTVTITVYIIKLFCMTYYRRVFIDMINLLSLPILSSYPDDADHYMKRTIKIVVFLTKTYRILCLGCMVLYAIYPFLDNKQLPFPFPYDLGNYTHLMYVFQMVSVCCASWNRSTMDTLQVSLLAVAATELDILSIKINNLFDDCKNGEPTKEEELKAVRKLKQCVKHHLTIIQFIENMEKIFGLAIFSQFIGSTLIICNTLFYFLLVSQASSIFILLADYLAIMVGELFMFCWFGNEIIVKSLKIADACYSSKWYFYGSEVRKYLFIIMERSRRPLAISVYSISSLSLEAFKSVIQWSYSCFALLLKLYYADS